MENDDATPVTDDQQQIDLLEPPPDKVVEPSEADQKIADMSETDIANQTFSDVGQPDDKDDKKPAGEKTGEEDDPDKILVPKEPDEQVAEKKDEKLPPRKGSTEWYEARMAAKDAHIKTIEEDNYVYRQQRREAKLEQSKTERAQKVAQLDDFERLSDREETELIEEDPEKYKVYVKQLAEYEKLKGQVGKEDGRFTQEQHADYQLEEYDDFLKQAFKFDYAVEAKNDRTAADKRYEELNAQPEVIQMAEALKGYQPGTSGLYSAKQMLLLYKGVTKDQAVTTATIDARKNLTNSINETQERVTFDKLPKAEGETAPQDVEKLTSTEIANMGPIELKAANEAIQTAMKKEAAGGGKTKKR